MAAFNFGAPKSNETSSGSLFGTAPATSGGSLFGNTATTSSGSSGGLFSFANNANTTTSTEQKSSLFGSNSGSLFGQLSTSGTASPPTFSFGQPSETNNPAEASKAPFSGFGQPTSITPATPSTSASTQGGSLFGTSTGASSGSLFGSTTPAPPKISFGQASTTPAGPPPATTSIFGQSTGANATANQNQSGVVDKTPTTQATSGAGLFGAVQSGMAGSDQKNAFSFKGFGSLGNPASSSTVATSTPATSSEPAKPFGMFSNQSSTPATNAAEAASVAPSSKPLFSFPSTTTPSAPESSKSLFGNTNSSTSASTSSVEPATTSKPLFGALTSTPGTTSQTTTTAPTFSLTPGTTSQGAPKTTSGFSLFQPASTSSSTPVTSAPASTSAFGGFAQTTPSSTSQTQSTTPATTGTAATAPAGPIASGLSVSALATSTSGPAPTSQSRLRNKTMDEILTRWALDLNKYTKEFRAHAETIAHWDQMLVDNMSKISKLYSQTFTAEKQTDSVDMQLTAVENQQNELEYWMNNYEKIVDDMLEKNASNVGELGGPDQERERTYQLAEKLGERLEEMGRDLEGMVEEINAANASLSVGKKGDEPITQIVRILNSHLTQLQTIDQGTAALQAKVAAAQKAASSLGYLNGANSGNGGAAVDDFYRSYMGRRS